MHITVMTIEGCILVLRHVHAVCRVELCRVAGNASLCVFGGACAWVGGVLMHDEVTTRNATDEGPTP